MFLTAGELDIFAEDERKCVVDEVIENLTMRSTVQAGIDMFNNVFDDGPFGEWDCD